MQKKILKKETGFTIPWDRIIKLITGFSTYINRLERFEIDNFIDIYYNFTSGSDIDSIHYAKFTEDKMLKDLIDKYWILSVFEWFKKNVWGKKGKIMILIT